MAYFPPQPNPDQQIREDSSTQIRTDALESSRSHVTTTTNGEASRFENTWPTNFTKGLPHTVKGIVDPAAFKIFFDQINAKGASAFEVPLGPKSATGSKRPSTYTDNPDAVSSFFVDHANTKVRGWESPRAGHVYDLEGPDSGSVAMAPAPALGSDELVAEMAEDYAMALLRDTPFERIRGGKDQTSDLIGALNHLPWYDRSKDVVNEDGNDINYVAKHRRNARFEDGSSSLSSQSLFRGSSFGCMDGPYISQFLLIGNGRSQSDSATDGSSPIHGYPVPGSFCRTEKGEDGVDRKVSNDTNDGYIVYGAQRIDQRVDSHRIGLDHMTDWATWLDVQNGADHRGRDEYEENHLRFVTTPRDLATYVHFDALYQAYLNACLFLLAIDAATDSGFPEGGDTSNTRTPFATFGGPHILTLVTETATRSLKAVRRQKYNHHLRARPEAIGAVTALAATSGSGDLGAAESYAKAHLDKLNEARYEDGTHLLERVSLHNEQQNQAHKRQWSDPALPDITDCNYLLPMAFPEGSPMHPAYGAGHATVAGSCVTILKCFFELFQSDSDWTPRKLNATGKIQNGKGPIQTVFVPTDDGSELIPSKKDRAEDLTLVGELNKLAANISIGRNMAGVHYYSDYFDSLRMGERIALGMMMEQMYTYPEAVSMRLTSFDGERLTLKTDGTPKGVEFLITDDSNQTTSVHDSWWSRFLPPVT